MKDALDCFLLAAIPIALGMGACAWLDRGETDSYLVGAQHTQMVEDATRIQGEFAHD